MKTSQSYLNLRALSQIIHTYSSILTLLHWDQETYMPPGGITPRSQQISLLTAHIHELKTGRKYRTLLGKLISLTTGTLKQQKLSKLEKVAVQEWHNEFMRTDKLPSSFVKNFSQITSEASQIWQTAKKENNFKLFAPFLKKIIELNREKAALYGYDDHPYDALLASYEPCITSAKLKTLFNELKKELVHLLERIKEARPIDDSFLRGSFDAAAQKDLGLKLLASLPLEHSYSRLDLSAHPFSLALHPHDSRITTRILEEGFMSNLFSILHEAGHSLYEMGLPAEHFGTPLAEAVSLSIHESQSRWWETLIGRSLPFWKSHYTLVQKAFPKKLKKIPLQRFYKAINKVAPSFIRVEADEVTYCLHVILRFELELALISGQLQVEDLPTAWNRKMEDFFGITPPTDREGCLQDIHWSLGDFGYFPTYALGNLCSAQFFETFTKKNPDWSNLVAEGQLEFIRDWLKTEIHSRGKQYNTEQLVKLITGDPLSTEPYCRYLKKKYTELYKL